MIDGGLRIIFREKLPRFDWQSIESGLTGLGIPDSNCCADGSEFWIEYKLTSTNRVLLRPEQVAWLGRRARAGGQTFIAVRYRHKGGPRKGNASDNLILYRGKDAKAVFVEGLRFPPIRMWAGGPSRWNWDEIAEILKKRG